MDSYSRNVEWLQRMLQECEVLSDGEDDSESETDSVSENEVMARTYYTCKMEVYAGKQPDGPLKVDNSSFAVVTRLISEISGSGRNVTFDNWYTIYPLVVSLLHDHKLSAVGTFCKNKREILDEFLSVKNRAFV